MVRNVIVNGNVTIIGDTVGGAFGLVGERVYVKNVDVNISGNLAGVQYSAGIAGENRGVIDNDGLLTQIADGAFNQSSNVSSGLVGFNLGGLIRNAKVQVNIKKSGYGKIVGGAVGRNIYGTINNVYVDGELNAYFTGGIVGASYTNKMLINATTGAGTISAECKTNNSYLIPNKVVEYLENGDSIRNYENVSLSMKTLEYLVNASKEFYSYKTSDEPNPTFNMLIIKNKVLGLVVGLGYEDSVVEKIEEYDSSNQNVISFKYAISLVEDGDLNYIVFNPNNQDLSVEYHDVYADVVLKDVEGEENDVKHTFTDVNVLTISAGNNYIMYLTGYQVKAFDSWYNEYSNEFVIIKMANK